MKFSDMRKGYAGMNAGVWVGDIGLPLFDGIQLKVRRLWNPDYIALYEKLMGEPDAVEADVVTKCLLDTCLVDWSGVDDPYTPEAARTNMEDPEFGTVFRGAVLWSANKVAAQMKEQIEADAKN